MMVDADLARLGGADGPAAVAGAAASVESAAFAETDVETRDGSAS